ncbi:PREDICTED: vacuolar protein sorting-associated protein 13A-like [Amphimedon queenslandica]|uniref:Intermembrane lipid transfer protein VPS13-like C-terminal domain-containing protein n=1 Tax=Amphimedon queenslandica TaxID=400682 RepID=A0AAN0ILF5_AMPQE|nr:PREDICTED: vacuolar protein sorting-associated protein 13A-like [Amphimedon queenslandica]|eukprot:XP_011403538.2 PREDICTED: vacuolar protein sorting-associated protein 13A-like [Amphimedon queenslandica]
MKKPEVRSRSASPIHGGGGSKSSPTHKGMASPVDGAWSPLSREQSALLETAWRTRETSIKIAEEDFNLDTMMVTIERGGIKQRVGSISRSFNPGIWVWYSHCVKTSSVSVKLGLVQIDNQLDDVELPTRVVFSSKEMQHLSEEITDPFLDFIITLSTRNPFSIREIEKCFLKIKPLRVNIELGVVAALLPFTDVIMATGSDEFSELGKEDMSLINKPLKDILKTDSLVKVRTVNHIDVLQIAQASLSVTYTTAGEYDLSSQWGKVVNALIHFALITKGSFDINLKSVTISNEVLDAEQIKRLIWGHYKNEMLLQFQRFALGLDVIGNPVKLLSSFQVGAKDLVNFSRQGLTEGDAGTHIAAGVKSFLGHFIEGSAGSGVRSTAVLSSLLLAATDIEYQRKHRYMRQARNENDLTSNLKLGSTFFIKGVFHGATDIIVKPITGASSKGFEGFMKGIGRGAISVLVKPTLGAVDLAKYTMEGIRSSVDDELTVETSRLPRLIHSDKVVTPYNSHEAEGLYIVRHLSEPLLNDHYVFHEWLPSPSPSADPLLLLVTSRQLMQLCKSKRHYRCEWSTGLDSIIQIKAMKYSTEDHQSKNDYTDFGILLEYKDENIFRKKQNKFLLKLEDTVGAELIEEKINNARKTFIKQDDG